jgi:hypothetical protein
MPPGYRSRKSLARKKLVQDRNSITIPFLAHRLSASLARFNAVIASFRFATTSTPRKPSAMSSACNPSVAIAGRTLSPKVLRRGPLKPAPSLHRPLGPRAHHPKSPEVPVRRECACGLFCGKREKPAPRPICCLEIAPGLLRRLFS